MAVPFHRNPNGNWCRCPWGDPTQEKYQDPHDQEVLGSVKESMWHEASKLDWLRKRPDMEDPQSQAFLDQLEADLPEHDPLYPWLVREWKKQRLLPLQAYGKGREDALGNLRDTQYQDPYPFTHINGEGQREGLDTHDLQTIQDWMKYKKKVPGAKGVDIMTHHVGDALAEARKWDQGGEVVHEDDHYGVPYKILKLRDRRDLRREGARMNHCVGNSSQRYDRKLDNNESTFYSVRDSRNVPHATLELDHTGYDYYMCPGCKKPARGEFNYEDGDRTEQCENCGTPKPEDAKMFPVDLKKMKHPDARWTEASQLYGPNNDRVDDNVTDFLNSYLSGHGHDTVYSDGEEPEEEEFEPWWDSYYSHPGASNVDDFFDWHVNGDYHDSASAPDEYDRAWRDANEHELEGPDLNLEPPDIDEIFQNLIDKARAHGVDPEEIARLFHHMDNEGHHHEWNENAKTWLEDEYEAFLDPYGQTSGPGYGLGGPKAGPDAPAFNEPGAHYPAGYPHEEYLARNFQHHLDKLKDPQTGNEYSWPDPYPERSYNQDYPTLVDDPSPVTEETGPVRVQVPADPNNPNYQRRYQPWTMELPYGRGLPGEGPSGRPGDPTMQGQFDVPRDDRIRPRPTPRARPTPPTPPFAPRQPTEPEHLMEENTTLNQRALPIPGAYDPVNAESWNRGEWQGRLFPKGWYIDYAKQRARQTDLPAHLFPPDKFGYHDPGAASDTHPVWSNVPGYGSYINTHAPAAQTGDPIDVWQQWQENRPPSEWTAKTADREQAHAPSEHGISHLHGRVRESNASHYPELPGDFAWRLPTVYVAPHDVLYVGQPSMEHTTLMQNFDLESPWDNGMPREGHVPGYIDLTGKLGEGGLHFWGDEQNIPDAKQFHDWVEQRFGVRRQSDGPRFTDEDWITSKTAADTPYYNLPYGHKRQRRQEEYYEQERRKLEERAVIDQQTEDYWEDVKNGNIEPNYFQWKGPGTPGKAFLDEDGQAHSWDDDGGSRYWMHSSQAFVRGTRTDPDTHIYINNAGSVSDRYNVAEDDPEKAKSLYEQLKANHPGVTWPALDGEPEQAPKPEYDDDLWEFDSAYHPRQDEEWAAGDEPAFSAIIPEPRWTT